MGEQNVINKIHQVLINLSNLEIKGEDNVLILAQSFVDLRQAIGMLQEQEANQRSEE